MGTYKSIRGPITSDWKIADNKFTLNIAIPPNTTATVYVPTTDAKSVTESGKLPDQAKGVKFLRVEKGNAVFAVESGRYAFVSELSR
jgi:alpha-L-rhamnosidase